MDAGCIRECVMGCAGIMRLCGNVCMRGSQESKFILRMDEDIRGVRDGPVGACDTEPVCFMMSRLSVPLPEGRPLSLTRAFPHSSICGP